MDFFYVGFGNVYTALAPNGNKQNIKQTRYSHNNLLYQYIILTQYRRNIV